MLEKVVVQRGDEPTRRNGPFSSSPAATAPLPAVALSLPCRWTPPAAPTALPERRPAVPSPSSASQPPPLPRSALCFAGKAPETRPRRQNSGVAATVPPPAATVAFPVRRPTSPPPPSAPRRRPHPRHHLLLARSSPEWPPRRRPVPPRLRPAPVRRRYADRRRRVVLSSSCSSVSPEHRRPCWPLHPHRRRRPFGRPFILAGSSSRGAASVVGFAAARSTSSPSPCSCRRLPSSSPRWPRSSSSSSSRRSRSSWRSSLRQAVLVRRPRLSSVPLQPRRRLRPRLRVVTPRAGRVSPSSKDRRRSRPLAVRPRSSRPPPPRPFVVVVPTPRRVVACSFACVLRVASVVPEVPEAWFVVVAKGSEGRSL
ncbi:uncharacterized protein [Oryza sativa Japonica Group]|uniref:uncharacterized protein n=1 Tax=Oryza sativa subsp. japonica TaxID=39947 RepID=UPI00339C3E84